MRIWAILLMLSLAVFAGCADEKGDTEAVDETGDGSGPGTDGGDESSDDTGDDASDAATGGNNTAPEASLEASALNGTAPLNVTLTVDGSDADGDNLTWSLSQGDNETGSGDTLPATVNVTLGEGNHTFILTISDGEASATANVTIVATAAAAAGPLVHPDPIYQESHMIEGCELCIDSEMIPTMGQMGAAGCAGWNLGENEVDCAWVAIPDGYAGFPWSAFSYTDGNIPELGSDGDVDIEFFDGCSSDANSMGIIREASFGEPESGIVPEGAKCMVGFEFSWPNAGHTIEFSIGADIHTDA